jgi:hypothetical protein
MMRRMRFGAAVLAAVAVLGGCKDGTGPRHGDPARVEVVSGSGQQGTAGQPLPQPVQVRVVDAAGRPVPDEVVNFVVTGGGGSVSAASVQTDDDGIAATLWTLGTNTGAAQRLEARVGTAGGQALVSEPITATATAAGASRVVPLLDTLLGGVAGAVMLDTLAVRVLDAFNNPVPGATVTWTPAGGGSVAPISATTDAQGVARALWTLGTSPNETYLATASAAGAQVTFRALPATIMEVYPEPQAHMARAGTAVSAFVRLRSYLGPIAGVRVRWQVTSGGGTATAFTRTNAEGITTTPWTFGSAAAQQGLTATAGNLQVTFSGTATVAGTRTRIAQVPGSILDIDETRVLWQGEVSANNGGVWIRRRGTTADSLITRLFVANGKLFPDGAVMWRYTSSIPTGEVLVARNGTVTSVSPMDPNGPFAVEGDWAGWATSSNGYTVRRNLRLGVTDTLANSPYRMFDIGSSGDAAGVRAGTSFLVVWRANGSQYTTGQNVLSVRVVGNDVAYNSYTESRDPLSAWLDQPGDDLLLASPAQQAVYGGGGWLGFTRSAAPTGVASNVFRRAPDGTVEQLTFDLWWKGLEDVSPTGWILFRASESGGGINERWFMSVPGHPLIIDLGQATGNDRVVWRGDRFVLFTVEAVPGYVSQVAYELTP